MDKQNTETTRSLGLLFFLIIIIGLSAIVPSKWIGITPKRAHYKSLNLSSIPVAQEVATDSNHDGKITWKEVMESTLPTMTTAQKEALKKIPVDSEAIKELNDPDNLTASFSKNLYLTASYMQKNGLTDEASQKNAIAKLMQEEASKIKNKKYLEKDIIITKTESRESIKSYGNTIAPLLDQVITKETITNEVMAFHSFSETKDINALVSFKKNKVRLDEILKKLEKVPTPPSAVLYHIRMLNKVAAHRDLIDNFAKSDTDPLRGSLVAESYINVSRSVINLFRDYSSYFNVKNVVFTTKDAGYIFMNDYVIH